MGLNGGDQSVTIDLPGLLHGGSSVTTNEHPYMKIDIPSPTPEEQDGANLPLGGGHATQTLAIPRTHWKPRVTLMAEVGELLTWGMTEDYDCEPEHSAPWRRSLLPKQTYLHHRKHGGASSAIGHIFSGQCSRDRGLYGK